MYHRVRRKMRFSVCAIILLLHNSFAFPKTSETTEPTHSTTPAQDNYDNNIIDFDEEYSVKFNKNYGTIPPSSNDKISRESHRYTIVVDNLDASNKTRHNDTKIETKVTNSEVTSETTQETDYSVIPLELISTTQNYLVSIVDSTTEDDLSVIPLATTVRDLPTINIHQAVTLPSSTQEADTTTETTEITTIINIETTTAIVQTSTVNISTTNYSVSKNDSLTDKFKDLKSPQPANVTEKSITTTTVSVKGKTNLTTETTSGNKTKVVTNRTLVQEVLVTNSTKQINATVSQENSDEDEKDVPIFTELDTAEEDDVAEDYYDSKEVVPTTAPKTTNALTVLVGLAGSVVESVAERVVPKGIFDLFKRMQRQNEALEAEKLRSREENGGLGQFGRGILKSISSGLSKPFSQLMAGVRDIGSLDTDRGFVSNLASGVTSVATVANSVVDTFKDRVQAIYPGTVWCGDGHSPTARSGELGLFFFTDTCCRQHDACKLYIKAGHTKYGLTNTGLFTRSHCSCDVKFRECLRRTNSLVSAQIGLTYFNVLGPQCFRRTHPIVRCARKTRITGQKCEEYELDITKPKMWQWFDNETF